MLEQKNYWNKQKRKFFVAILLGVIVIVLLSMILLGITNLVRWLYVAWSTVNMTGQLQILSFLFNGLLTMILVGATCLYAWLTWRMVKEIEESRQLGKRPALILDLGPLEVDQGHDDSHMMLTCQFRILNVGSGSAILPAGEITLPYRVPNSDRNTWLLDGIRTSLPDLPQTLQVGMQSSSTVKLDTTLYEIPKGLTPEFASIELKYQDAERNLFKQTFSFNIFRAGTHNYFSVAHECLKMTVFKKRRVGDERVSIEVLPDPAEIIYERADFL